LTDLRGGEAAGEQRDHPVDVLVLVEAAQVEIETENSKWFIIIYFRMLTSRRFQLGFDRVNLQSLTS
jgi:hypothetical protein